MTKNIGFRIKVNIKKPSLQLLDEIKLYPTANVADCMNRFFCISSEIRLMNKNKDIKMVGFALTVKTRPVDNLMVHKAIDMAKQGDIIVVDANGDINSAIIGEIITLEAINKKLSGIIIDGCVRDISVIEKLNFPVFAKGITPKGPYKDGPGEINFPISCGGVKISPGDILVGDADGIVVIPHRDLKFILEKVKEKAKTEYKIIQGLEKGINPDKSWIDEILCKKGCEVVRKDSVYD